MKLPTWSTIMRESSTTNHTTSLNTTLSPSLTIASRLTMILRIITRVAITASTTDPMNTVMATMLTTTWTKVMATMLTTMLTTVMATMLTTVMATMLTTTWNKPSRSVSMPTGKDTTPSSNMLSTLNAKFLSTLRKPTPIQPMYPANMVCTTSMLHTMSMVLITNMLFTLNMLASLRTDPSSRIKSMKIAITNHILSIKVLNMNSTLSSLIPSTIKVLPKSMTIATSNRIILSFKSTKFPFSRLKSMVSNRRITLLLSLRMSQILATSSVTTLLWCTRLYPFTIKHFNITLSVLLQFTLPLSAL